MTGIDKQRFMMRQVPEKNQHGSLTIEEPYIVDKEEGIQQMGVQVSLSDGDSSVVTLSNTNLNSSATGNFAAFDANLIPDIVAALLELERRENGKRERTANPERTAFVNGFQKACEMFADELPEGINVEAFAQGLWANNRGGQTTLPPYASTRQNRIAPNTNKDESEIENDTLVDDSDE